MLTPKAGATSASFKLCHYLDGESGSTILPLGKYILQSPNYPANYSDSTNTSWSFTVDWGNTISIACPFFDMEEYSGGTCLHDWLDINGVHHCGNSSIAEISTDHLYLQFVSDDSLHKRGFSCNITVTNVPTPDPGGGSDGNCTCGHSNRVSRIVGGIEAEENEYPWQAAILVFFSENVHFCGGSVINSEYVLTAAHCTAATETDRPKGVAVLLGSRRREPKSSDEFLPVAMIMNHPLYNSDSKLYDYALLKLSSPISFGPNISPVCLPKPGEMYTGASAIASGFGLTSTAGNVSDVLLEVDQRVWSPQECAALMQRVGMEFDSSVMVCAGGEAGKGTCHGDSGGPLVTEVDGRYVLIGAASFVFSVGCGADGYPGFYSRITGALDWIRAITADSTFCS